MRSAYQEVRALLTQISVAAHTPAIVRASDQIDALCRAYMEPDQAIKGSEFGLSPSRAKMFALLLKRRGQVVSREALLNVCIHQDEPPDIKIIDVQMSHLRKKLPEQYRIETVWGVGYRLAA